VEHLLVRKNKNKKHKNNKKTPKTHHKLTATPLVQEPAEEMNYYHFYYY
jgi:ribosomal protein L35